MVVVLPDGQAQEASLQAGSVPDPPPTSGTIKPLEPAPETVDEPAPPGVTICSGFTVLEVWELLHALEPTTATPTHRKRTIVFMSN
jgi:hypothetical protein